MHFTDGLAAALEARGPTLVVGWTRRFPARFYPGTVTDTSTTRVSADGVAVLDVLDPRTWRAAARRIVSHGADLAVLQWWHPIHAPVLISMARRLRRAGVSVAIVCHNVEPHETNRLWRMLTRRALRTADTLIVHASALRPVAERLAPGVPVIEAFLPIFTNVAAAAGEVPADGVLELRRRLGALHRPLLLAFGYVRPYKGIEDAIRAMAHLQHDAVLLVAGECWDDHSLYEREAARIGERVALDLRYIPNEEIPVLFGSADAVVLPYRTATQSAVAALAFAYDRPVVATRAGGLHELVEDGVTGALAPPADPVALAAAVDRVLADPSDWASRIAPVRERLSWSRYVDMLEHITPRTRARDPRTHAVLDRASRRSKAQKILSIVTSERPVRGSCVLDIGTGSGTIASELARAAGPGGRVTSVDVDDVRVDREGYAFATYDGHRLPFPDATFDLAISNHVIEHVGDATAQQNHVDEIARVLRPGGVAYVAAPNRLRLVENHYRLPFLSWLPRELADRYVARSGRGTHYDCLLTTWPQLARMMRRAGLEPRNATGGLVDATLARWGRFGALASPAMRAVVRGPLAPTIAAIGRRPTEERDGSNQYVPDDPPHRPR